MTIKEMLERKNKLITDARAILDSAETEKRKLTTEQDAEYETLMGEVEQLRAKISRETRTREAERESLAALEAQQDELRNNPGVDGGLQSAQADAIMASFRGYLIGGTIEGDGAEEFRDLSAGVDVQGGHLVVPQAMIQALITGLDEELFIRKLATVIPLLNGSGLGAASLDADPDDAEWVGEIETSAPDNSMRFGKRDLKPHPMSKLVLISSALLRTAAMNAEALLNARIQRKLGVTMEKAYLTGNGNLKPLGLFVASNSGVSVARDISEDNTATAFTMDGLKSAKWSLKGGHVNKANWLFHQDGVKLASKMKDDDGQYIWHDSTKEGEPDRLLGRPVLTSDFCPNTFTTGQYVGLFGNFEHYWILDSLLMQIQRLNELYSLTNQIGFLARYEGDGAPVLEEAFARITLG